VTATEKLHELGQSIWLDNITRKMLDSGQLQTYIDDYAVTGLTSNPSIFDKAIAGGSYDDAIRERVSTGVDREALFFDLAIEDLRRAADAFLPIHERTAGLDGWVSLEVSPLLAYDADRTVEVATSRIGRQLRRSTAPTARAIAGASRPFRHWFTSSLSKPVCNSTSVSTSCANSAALRAKARGGESVRSGLTCA
jgi:hypothetical protein